MGGSSAQRRYPTVRIAAEMEDPEAAATASSEGVVEGPPHCYSPHSRRNIFGWKWRRRRGEEEEEEEGTSTFRASSELIMQDLLRHRKAVITPSSALILLLLVVLLASLSGTHAAPQQRQQENFSAQVEAAVTEAEAAAALEAMDNCFSAADESTWTRVLVHNGSVASLRLDLLAAGPDVMTCLTDQRKFEVSHRHH